MGPFDEHSDFRSILGIIETQYPKSRTRVSSDFVQMLYATIMSRYAMPPDLQFELRKLFELDLKRSRSQKGLLAADLYGHLMRLRGPFGRLKSGPDTQMSRLEAQLRDIRSMVGSPADVEKRLDELQDQVETIQRNAEIGSAVAAEKAGDQLQKFLAASKRAFIIMPFQRDLENVWFGAIKPACIECTYAPLRVDEVNLSSLITDDIEKYSAMSHVVIVDLSDSNPNVMFEFGWSLAKNKKPIVICQGELTNKIPFDVRGIRYISYENSWLGIEALKKKMKEYIETSDKQIPPKKKRGKGKQKPSSTTAKAEAK